MENCSTLFCLSFLRGLQYVLWEETRECCIHGHVCQDRSVGNMAHDEDVRRVKGFGEGSGNNSRLPGDTQNK